MSEKIEQTKEVPTELGNQRFDAIAAQLFGDFSRSKLTEWIKAGQLTVDGQIKKPKEKLLGGEELTLNAVAESQGEWEAEEMPLDVVFEDDHILVINKPAGLVVHPAAGNSSGTLLNGLLHHAPELRNIPRAGIVHRLDKDTTGLMVVAKTLQAQHHIVDQLQTREMGREYEAVVQGVMTGGGMVDEPISRHPTQRTKMAVHATGKEAITHYRLIQKFRSHTHIRCKLETGRTHQIRVHMSHINYPLVGDQTYGGRFRLPKGITDELQDALKSFKRQALHAKRLELFHPYTDEQMEWEIPLPDDIEALLDALAQDYQQSDAWIDQS